VAHRYERWTLFADLVLRFVSCGQFEANAGYIFVNAANIG
jgi:hypothetical protein